VNDSCSVVLPIFNSRNILNEGLNQAKSILGADDELIVVNDGSTDISPDELFSLIGTDRRIVLFNRDHFGLVSSLNFAIKHASNEIIARADIDDVYAPDRLRIQKAFLNENHNISAVFSDYSFIDELGGGLGEIRTAIFPQLTRLSLINPQRTPHPVVMFRKSAFEEVGGYLAEDFPAEDLGLWLRMARQGEIATLPQILLNYRLSKGGISLLNQRLSRSKTTELLQNFDSLLPAHAIEDIVEFGFSEYDNSNHGFERQLFMIRDVRRYNELFPGILNFSQILKKFISYNHSPLHGKKLMDLYIQVQKRKLYRN
jgi:glycosyltransferase involved in cell wall biosynthesis